MEISLFGIGFIIISVGIFIFTLYSLKLVKALSDAVVASTEVITMSKETVDEANEMLRTVNEITNGAKDITEDVKKLTGNIGEIYKSIENSLAVFKTFSKFTDKFSSKKKE